MNLYFLNTLKTSLLNIKCNKQVFIMSVMTTAIAFSIIGIFFLVFTNLNILLSKWNKEVQLIVYIEDKVSKDQLLLLENSYTKNKNIHSVDFISKDEAWNTFKNTFSDKSKFIKMLDFNPLPASYIIKFKDGADRLINIRSLAEQLKYQKGVESIEYGEKWIARFQNFMVFLEIVILSIGGVLCVGLVLIISNTIKLSIYSRQDEIDLMTLLGAKSRSIKAPLLLEGILQSVLGVLIALIVIKIIHIFIRYHFQGSLESIFRSIDLQFLTNPLIWVMIFISIFVGWLGSLISINHFLHTRNDK